MANFENILYEVSDGRARITLNRPDKLNALSLALQAELHEALWEADNNRAVHCVILKGAGRAFSAGYDLAGGGGDNWDTHRNHFPKMKDRLLPVFDRSASALLTDLEQRGMLEETLVVFLTDFGRTPRINNNGGRDHYPAVYSAVLAGGGIQGGQVYGTSNTNGTAVASGRCTPADVHATVFKALGIDHHAELKDSLGRPFRICDGQPLPLI